MKNNTTFLTDVIKSIAGLFYLGISSEELKMKELRKLRIHNFLASNEKRDYDRLKAFLAS